MWKSVCSGLKPVWAPSYLEDKAGVKLEANGANSANLRQQCWQSCQLYPVQSGTVSLHEYKVFCAILLPWLLYIAPLNMTKAS